MLEQTWNTLVKWILGGTENTYHSMWFEFGGPLGLPIAVLLLLILLAGGSFFWWSRLRQIRGWRRTVLISLRVAALALLLFLVLDPSLVARRNEPGRHFVLLLLDDSLSMQIPDGDGPSRAERFLNSYTALDSRFEQTLRESHQLVLFRFGRDLDRIRNVQDLTFEQKRSDLIGAIDSALSRMAGTNVSAVVLFSDGVQQADEPSEGTVVRAYGNVPVFTVGTGTESRWRSLELAGTGKNCSSYR